MAAVHPDDAERVFGEWERASGQGRDSVVEYRFLRPDGSVCSVEGYTAAVHDDRGALIGWLGTCVDMTARREAEDAAARLSARFAAAFDNAPIGMALVGTDGRWLQVNQRLCELTGYSPVELLERTFQEITHPDDLDSDLDQARRMLSGEIRSFQIEKRYLRKDGSPLWVMLSVSLVRDGEGNPLYFVSQIEDIGGRKRAEAELERVANHDFLTALANRRKLIDDLKASFAAPEIGEFELAIYDLNGFKTYNDMFGHLAGDAMLARLSQALAAAVGDDGTAYRIGGDEFCVVAAGGPADDLFSRAQAALSAQGEWFSIEAAYGQVAMPAEASEVSTALQIADARLYARKQGARTSAVQQARDALLQVMIEQDPELSTHVSRVAELAQATAQQLGLDDEEVWHVRLAAQLHDIGKAALPESLLDKPTALDAREWTSMKRHTVTGERIVKSAPALSRVAGLVRSTHERTDGAGYPDGLAGDEIPLGSRIVAVADAFDAMISTRRYAPARSVDDAVAELQRCAGTQFDPEVVAAFVEAMTGLEEQADATGGPREQQGADVAASTESRVDHDAARGTTGIDLQRRRRRLERALARARARHWERPVRAETIADCVGERALALGDSALYGRARLLQAQIAMRHGLLERAFDLIEEARAETKRSGAAELRTELAIAQSRLSFLVGLYTDALAQAEEAVALADRYQLAEQRIVARRGLSLVLGNTEQSERLRTNADELLELAIEAGDRREEAMARNDLAYALLQSGELTAVHREIEGTISLCKELQALGEFPLAYAYSTRAELRIASGDATGAVADCDESLALANASENPEPYLTAMTTHTKIEALIAASSLELALTTAHTELERLRDDVPHARSLILRTIADALLTAGRADEAFAALRASADLDRAAFEQLAARQLDVQRAALEAKAARHEAELITAKNAELEERNAAPPDRAHVKPPTRVRPTARACANAETAA